MRDTCVLVWYWCRYMYLSNIQGVPTLTFACPASPLLLGWSCYSGCRIYWSFVTLNCVDWQSWYEMLPDFEPKIGFLQVNAFF